MKKLLVFSCLAVFIFGVVASAGALMYYDEYDPNDDIFLQSWGHGTRTVSWTFDIIQYGFNPSQQDVLSAAVALSFYDDGGWCDAFEFAMLHAGDNFFLWEVDTEDIAFSVASLMTLSDSGKVDCSLTALWGDFYLDKALLSAEATDGPIAPVPEPSIMLLLGCGFVCVAGFGWKRFSKKSTDHRQ